MALLSLLALFTTLALLFILFILRERENLSAPKKFRNGKFRKPRYEGKNRVTKGRRNMKFR